MDTVLKVPANEFDHHFGPLNAPVVIIEYGDYECPYSASLAPVMERLISEYRTDICFVYRHFPQTGIHPEAELAAIASEAADEQSKFWEMHKKLFESSSKLSANKIRTLARDIGLNMELFEKDMQRYELFDKIKNDYRNGEESGVVSTPTIYINDVLFQESSTYWPLREAIELAIGNFRSAWL